MAFSTAKQRQKIGFFRNLLNLDYDVYLEILSDFGVTTSKNLSEDEAEKIIKQLKRNAISAGLYKPKNDYRFIKGKYEYLAGRKGMASPKQLRMIEAMWFKVSFQNNDNDRKQALYKFIQKITGKQRMEFLTSVDVRKIVLAIRNMEKK